MALSPLVSLPDGVKHLLAGTSGGLIATAALYPLELVKTRMQVLADYKSILQSFKVVLGEEGFRGLYQGMTPALIAASGSWGGYFYFYELSKARKLANKGPTSKLGTIDHLLSGVEAGVYLVLLFNPLWVMKTRLALQGAEIKDNTHTGKKYTGLYNALATSFKEEGLRGWYKGLVPALLLTSHGAVQFACYEWMKAFAEEKTGRKQQAAHVSILLGGMSKVLASTLTYPYQLVKSRLQQRGATSSEGGAMEGTTGALKPRYTGTLDCVRKIWRTEGFRGFFRGVGPNALKVAPSSAITFLIYEEALMFMGKEGRTTA